MLLLVVVIGGLATVSATLFRAWNAEIKAHRQTIQENIEWTRQNTALIGEVRQTTERFAMLIGHLADQQRSGRRP
ncbi:MAG: hypothetical protein AAFX81_18490 [Pseudomonadota bacterium]